MTCSCGCGSSTECCPSSECCSCDSCNPCATVENTNSCGCCCVQNCDFFVINTAPFNMPACGGTATISIDNASRLFQGALLWNETVGYLVVENIIDNSTVVVRNDCLSCNVLDPGEPIAESTQFGVGIPSCIEEGDCGCSGPKLNLDFIIPAIGACIDILATTTEGLFVGEIVSIAGQKYRISAIASLTELTICNDGDAGPVGTLVEKDPNNDGTLDYPIIRVTEQNMCLADTTAVGKLLVCDTNVQKVMEGQIENQVPAWNPDTDQFELRVVDNIVECTVLTSCLVLDPSDPGPYLVTVEDATIFVDFLDRYPGVLIHIGADEFCINDVVNETSIHVTPGFPITEIVTYDPPAPVCVADCCEQCAPQLYTINRFNGDDPKEIIVVIPETTFTVAAGVSVETLPAGIGSAGTGGNPGDGLWALTYTNDAVCDCNKYVHYFSNFEVGIELPADVYANIEYRMCKTAPVFDTQAFAAIPVLGGAAHAHLPGLVGTPNLLVDLAGVIKTLNTFKGYLMDRDVVTPGASDTFEGHFRITFYNGSGAPASVKFQGAVRAWFTAWDADVGVS